VRVLCDILDVLCLRHGERREAPFLKHTAQKGGPICVCVVCDVLDVSCLRHGEQREAPCLMSSDARRRV